ncbi:MAG TPA: hypothetical protein DCZ94_16200 [Lentisphaeria bacterium]|nr:hypothetical protein [Lentisphaeria bacterium]
MVFQKLSLLSNCWRPVRQAQGDEYFFLLSVGRSEYSRENGQLGGYWEFTQTNPRNYYAFDRLRHSKSANVLYCDMHVSPMTNEEVMSKAGTQTLY